MSNPLDSMTFTETVDVNGDTQIKASLLYEGRCVVSRDAVVFAKFDAIKQAKQQMRQVASSVLFGDVAQHIRELRAAIDDLACIPTLEATRTMQTRAYALQIVRNLQSAIE